MEHKTNLGYVQRGCGVSTLDTTFNPVSRRISTQKQAFQNLLEFGYFCQIVFVWIVCIVLLKMTFRVYAQKTFLYSYDVYGMFWGITSTAIGFWGILVGVYIYVEATRYHELTGMEASKNPSEYLALVAVLTPYVVELPVAIYIARKATVAVPCIFKYPAILLCCGRKRRAERLVTVIALWVDLVVLQKVLLHVSTIVLALPAAPFAIASSVMLLVLALSCLTNIFSLLFTIFAHLCTPSHQRAGSSFMVLRALVVLPMLLMIMCYGIIIGSMGSVINMETKQNNPLSFINSIVAPILLGLISIFLKRFISAWLQWSPPEANNWLDTSLTNEVDEEILDPSRTDD